MPPAIRELRSEPITHDGAVALQARSCPSPSSGLIGQTYYPGP
jgi:hypothetical protein